jgi:TPP-dependent pyruvate/acetoin dehydrogenase alpha subunit
VQLSGAAVQDDAFHAEVAAASATVWGALEPELRRALFRGLLRVRLVEERIRKLYPEGDMRCPTHLSLGQEAVAVGLCSALGGEDRLISAHRSHAHYIARGGSIPAMFAELYGKSEGCASGKGGSMHLIDLAVNFLGCVPIVGSTIPIGVGAAFGARLQGKAGVTVIFFGDGAVETGVFHESVNFASVHRLPVIFVCENNLYSVNTPLAPRQPAWRSIVDLARGHGIMASQHDGQMVEAVYQVAAATVASVRAGQGPALLEFETYRWAEHCGPLGDLHLGYRSQAEFDGWVARCPVAMHRCLLSSAGLLEEEEEAQMHSAIDAEIDAAVAAARKAPFPARDALFEGVYA